MAYLGQSPAGNYTKLERQVITGDGGTSYTLDYYVANENELEVYVNNVRQQPGNAYTTFGTTLTMTGVVSASDSFYVVYQGKGIGTIGIPEKLTDGTYLFASNVAITGNLTVGTGTTAITNDSILTGNVIISGAILGNVSVGNTVTARSLTLSGTVTPTVISANTNDWAPGTTGVFEVRASANSDVNVEYNVTGLVAGANGQVVVITNTGTAPMVLLNQDAGSSAANRFAFPNHIKLYGSQTLPLYYDGISQKWRPVYSVGLAYDYKTLLTKGFFSGGLTSVVVATADRTNYSTETTAAVSGANLSVARRGHAAAGNSDKGFFSGGTTGSNVATADRTNYSTETTAAVSGANLSQARNGLAAAGNADKGFFSGGFTSVAVATADRTNYSTETTAAVSGANLSQARYYLAAAGNADKGFFSGGVTTAAVATADRTNYSTETTAAVSGANLSQARREFAAAGNADKGFFSGGVTTVNVATADRTNYSTETTAAVSGANLSVARQVLAAAGNADKGFFSGGYISASVATADRTNYSTETTAAVSGANLSQARYALAAA